MNKELSRRSFLKATGALGLLLPVNRILRVDRILDTPPVIPRPFNLYIKVVGIISTPAMASQIQQALLNSGLRPQLENKLLQLAATDVETSITAFEWRLKVIQADGEVSVYPKLVISGLTTRSNDQLLGSLDSYIVEVKTRLRSLASSFPATSITRWHYHLSTGSVDEVEL